MLRCLLLAAVAVSAWAQTPDADPDLASIEGRCINAQGLPLSNAYVNLKLVTGSVAGQRKTYLETSDENGRFSIIGIQDGEYELIGNRIGYRSTAYGAKRSYTPGIPLKLAKGSRLKNLEITLVAVAAVSGSVLNEDGEPLPKAQVALLSETRTNGEKRLSTGPFGFADEKGDFKLSPVSPGTYYLVASGKSGTETYSTTFYPSAPDSQSAVRIDVRDGADAVGFTIRMRKSLALHVRGKVVHSDSGLAAAQLHVVVWPAAQDLMAINAESLSRDSGRLKESGEFDLTVPAPGSYVILVSEAANRLRPLSRVPIEVGKSDIENLVVTVMPPIQVTVVARLEEAGNKDDKNGLASAIGAIQLMLLPVQGPTFLFNAAKLSSALTFSLAKVPQVPARFSAEKLPEGLYVKSIRMGDMDVLGRAFTPAAGARIEVVLSNAGGRIRGVVEDKEHRPVRGCDVIVAPDPARPDQAHLYRVATSDDKGEFKVSGIAPGNYRVYAWENLDTRAGMQFDEELARLHEGESVKVALDKKEVQQVKLRPIPGSH
jgi:protocatechuate 3,4-dioxygenase beta subunit